MSTELAGADGIGAGSIVRRLADGTYACVHDEVAIEEPLEIRVKDSPLAITMRTPGHDEELAAGFLFAEGIIHRRDDLRSFAGGAQPNILNVQLGDETKFESKEAQRFGTISSSCGLCGKTNLEAIRDKFAPLHCDPNVRMAAAMLLQLPDRLRAAQGNFSRTGGIHAAGIFDFAGNLLVAREDIGRHNAVDKAIGRAFLDEQTPLGNHVLMVSGRASVEIVQKALAAGIPIVASVSAPSSLAINFARAHGQTLVGFLRPPTFNIYSHIEQIEFAT